MIVYLSHWFIYQDRAKAIARFMSAIPIAYILGGPLAGAILGINWLGTPGWRWLFLLEGVPAVFLGIVTLFVLPDRPTEARWLAPNERDWIASRLAEERRAKGHLEEMSILQALRHPPVIILTLGLFFCYSGGYIFWFWMPTLLKRMTGWSDLHVGWIGAIPFIAGLIGMLVLGWNSDRTRRTALAFCRSAIDRRFRSRDLVLSAAFDRAAHGRVYSHWFRERCLSARVLGLTIRIPHERSSSCGSWLYQLHREHRRICRPKNFRRLESAHRIIQHRFRGDDRVLDYRFVACSRLSARARRSYFLSATSNGAPVFARMSSTVAPG